MKDDIASALLARIRYALIDVPDPQRSMAERAAEALHRAATDTPSSVWFLQSCEGLVLACFTSRERAEAFRDELDKPDDWRVDACPFDPAPTGGPPSEGASRSD